MSRRSILFGLALFGLGALGRSASAQDLKDRFNARVTLSGMYLTETQSEPDDLKRIAGPLSLGYGDLRLVLDARRLPGNFELHLDARLRGTGRLDSAQLVTGDKQITSRGYLSGPEYQVTELWARGRWSKLDLGLGRMIVTEADSMRIDGLRLWAHLHRRWDLSVYAGGYPDPYSRSVSTDYVYGQGVRGAGMAFAGGANARYGYDKVWGSFSVNAAYLAGSDDGGPLAFDAMTGAPLPATTEADKKLRAFATWTNFWRPVKWVDFYHDLVLDLAGAAGLQLTRLNVGIAGHVHRNVTIRASYDHMSAIAIEMFLSRLLQNRVDFVPGSIENNLTLSRTARDEARLAIEGQIARTTIAVEGRLRRRVLVMPENDPQFTYDAAAAATLGTSVGSQVAPSWGYEGTLSVRDRGSLWGLRPGLWVTYLKDFRARNVYVGVGIGRDFLRDRLNLDLAFTYANTRDERPDPDGACAEFPFTTALRNCFGTRKGHNLQANLTIGGSMAKHWYGFFDYRVGVGMTDEIPAVLTHVLLARLEARY